MHITTLGRSLLAALTVVVVGAGCSQESEPPIQPVAQISLASLGQGDLVATGVARHPKTGNLWLLARGVGLLEVSPDGKLVSQIKLGTHGLDNVLYNDVAVRADGTFALTANGEGYKYDPRTEKLEFYFCLVPSFEPIVRENDASAIDEVTGRIFVAPAYYDTSEGTRRLTRALLAQYAIADGAPLVENDIMETGVIAKGLVFDMAGGGVWALQGSQLVHFTGGGKLDGRTQELAGIEDGAGIAFDGDTMWVLDAHDGELRSFPRPGTN